MVVIKENVIMFIFYDDKMNYEYLEFRVIVVD